LHRCPFSERLVSAALAWFAMFMLDRRGAPSVWRVSRAPCCLPVSASMCAASLSGVSVVREAFGL
jgi:hypothetical protein